MVARKPVAKNAPSGPNAIPSIIVQEPWSPADPDPEAERAWADEDTRPDNRSDRSAGTDLQDVPDTLRPGADRKSPDESEENPWDDVGQDNDSNTSVRPKVTLEHVPTVLRPGGRSETNPFKRRPIENTNRSQDAAQPAAPPSNELSQLQLEEPEAGTNPWKPAIDEQKTALEPPGISPEANQESGSDVWGSEAHSRQPSASPANDSSPAVISLPSGRGSPAWDEDDLPQPSLPDMPLKSPEEQEFSQDVHAWDDEGSRNKGKQPAVALTESQIGSGEWNIIDHDPAPPTLSRQSTWENFVDAEGDEAKEQPKEEDAIAPAPPHPPKSSQEPQAPQELPSDEVPPTLPPRRSQELPPQQPPRPHTPSAANKSETYQIKNINWYDATATKNPRKSPILVQNANGPCPLVALVNALTLTTPAHLTSTVLVDTLRSREQISLNFLLEAVFDELMSPRRTKSDAALPDVTELYAFLKGLHTGMNVNPRYLPTKELVKAHKRTSLVHVHPSERNDLIPGTFEDTRDMKLYSTFSVPLIHGWLPASEDPVHDAFDRQASSYDDAQNLMFREEELDDKLSNSGAGLTEQEQQMFQDILTIKSWLSSSATQLTPWGLEVITKATQPGTFSILFRNDHFSTLYRHPQTMQLLTLVTDAGYYTHDEIVWESLVDVNGERAEFFSGDFRLVGSGPQHTSGDPRASNWYDDNAEASNNQGQWQTVETRQSRNRNSQVDSPSTPMSPTHEQEDRDLALALQLQEEEEERHRVEQETRRRESQLSEQFIEQQGRGNTARTGPRGLSSTSRGGSNLGSSRGGSGVNTSRGGSSMINIPVRGGGSPVPARGRGNTARGARPVQQVRPLVPPANLTHRPGAAEEQDAPPTYEQASKVSPYVPPAGHPSHPTSSLGSTTPSSPAPLRRTTLTGPSNLTPANRRQSNSGPTAGPSGQGRGRPPPLTSNNTATGGKDKDKDCAVM